MPRFQQAPAEQAPEHRIKSFQTPKNAAESDGSRTLTEHEAGSFSDGTCVGRRPALCAEKAHLVTDKASTVIDWPDLDRETMDKIRKKIDTGWNVHLDE